MGSDLLATALWAILALGLTLGILAAKTESDLGAFGSGIVSLVLTTAFSWAAALSIGPFVIAAPVILTALVASRHRPRAVRALSAASALVIYWVLVWGPTRTPESGLLLPAACLAALVLAYWAWRRTGTSAGVAVQ